ncbi:PEP-CTERM sorting domain-containing protein [Armatimonas rosea]|uniref:Ice-binding protein C-terminal domain-containing protein n=1 Tax=Armatimonas rosea TaxID=685828 RepID=A0A7W9SRB9_ARMRO|nr:PEP-CTERM sorting domain-containing protein [Armatimonas rosea]MBB6051395.1 hypothetical protein [Armatimonas rosea]
MKRLILPLVLVCAATLPASAQVQLSLLTSVSLTGAMGNGIQPSAVAWDGTNAWVGVYNNSGAAANTFIVPVANVLTSPTVGTSFGTFSTSNTRGISSLSVNSSGTLIASLDNGANNASSIRAFTGSTGTQLWALGDAAGGNDSAKRGNGTAFDPGFNGTGTNAGGAAFLSIGSGRRFVVNPTTGAYLNGGTGGNADAIINFSPTSTTWRDLAFDPATGDLYTRESNRIGKATRTSNNGFSGNASTTLVASVGATAVDSQNIAFVNNSATGNFLLVNNRASGASGQQLGTVLQAYTTTGTALTLAFTGIDPVATVGVGSYDFSYDSVSKTLAVSDFSNKQLYIFSVGASAGSVAPEPGTLALCALGLGVGLGLRRKQTR